MRDKLGPATRMLLGLVVASLSMVACGGEDDGASEPGSGQGAATAESGGGDSFELGASDNQFSPAELEVTKGNEITIEFSNNGENPHTFTIDGTDVDTGSVGPGETVTVTVGPLDANTPFKCSIHGASGMTGELVPG